MCVLWCAAHILVKYMKLANVGRSRLYSEFLFFLFCFIRTRFIEIIFSGNRSPDLIGMATLTFFRNTFIESFFSRAL